MLSVVVTSDVAGAAAGMDGSLSESSGLASGRLAAGFGAAVERDGLGFVKLALRASASLSSTVWNITSAGVSRRVSAPGVLRLGA
jgi:hypothetical protein